jgi:hypothetical protein
VSVRKVLVAVAMLMVVASGCGGTSVGSKAPGRQMPPDHTRVAVGAPDTFVADRFPPGQHGKQAVTISSATTGRILSVLLPDPWEGMAVNSTAVATGLVWVSLWRGPACSGDVAGCGPRPNSCASEVLRINPTSGASTVVLRGGPNELISDAHPNPQGGRLAYLASSCARSFGGGHVVIEDLADGHRWSIGAGLPVCHYLGSLAWTPSGSALVAVYGPSPLHAGQGANYGYGTCVGGPANRVAVVPASHGARGLPGSRAEADPGCQIEAVAPAASGYVAIEACGGPGFLDGKAYLLTYGPRLAIRTRTPIGACLDGAELAASHNSQHLLGNSYQYCNPPGTLSQDIAFVETTNGPKTIIDERHTDTATVSALSW